MTERQRLQRRKAEDEQKKKIVREAMRKIKLSNEAPGLPTPQSPQKRSWKMSDGPDNEEACFLCTQQRVFLPGVERLMVLLSRNYGICDNEAIALQLHNLFTEEIYHAGMGNWMLTTEMALEHIEGMHLLPLDPVRFSLIV